MSAASKAYNLIIVLGPTATGKTQFAANLAHLIDAEIISADSRQIYRKMDLGTGKDYQDYIVHGKPVPSHLIDIHEAGYKYNVFEFQQDFVSTYQDIIARGKKPILCGGTGMYIDSVTKAYKLISVPVNQPLREKLKSMSMEELKVMLQGYKKMHNRSDTDTTKRAIRAIEIAEYYSRHPQEDRDYPPIRPIYFGLSCDREIRRERITKRLQARLKEGMVEEVDLLLKSGIAAEDLIYYGLEYKFITLYLTGKLEYDTMVQQLNTAIHQFAKRQMTWFRKMEREGIIIHWIDSQVPMNEKMRVACEILGVKQ